MDNDTTPAPPPGYHFATGEELRCLPEGSKYYSRGRWVYSEGCGENLLLVGTPLQYACLNVQSAPPPLDPKASQALQKPQLQSIPPVINIEMAAALQSGANKYGPWNWRSNHVEMMTYIGAMRRHIDALLDGEDRAPDSGVHHLGHVAASCAIVLDAARHGTLVDNRPGAINTEAQ